MAEVERKITASTALLFPAHKEYGLTLVFQLIRLPEHNHRQTNFEFGFLLQRPGRHLKERKQKIPTSAKLNTEVMPEQFKQTISETVPRRDQLGLEFAPIFDVWLFSSAHAQTQRCG